MDDVVTMVSCASSFGREVIFVSPGLTSRRWHGVDKVQLRAVITLEVKRRCHIINELTIAIATSLRYKSLHGGSKRPKAGEVALS